MFEKLQELPLLMGLSIHELMTIVEKVKFDFQKYNEGTTIVNQGDRCDKITYILSGQICADHRDDNRNILISEYITETPFALEPENLWGMKQKYTHSYTFTSDGSTCTIDKWQLSSLISDYEIVKTNILSLVCNKLQSAHQELNRPISATTEARLIDFVRTHSITKKGKKAIRVKMEVLADIIDDTRLNVSRTLNNWQDKRLVEIHRGCLTIFDTERLINQL